MFNSGHSALETVDKRALFAFL